MSNVTWMVIGVLAVLLMLSATTSAALRCLSRTRLEEKLAQRGRSQWLERLALDVDNITFCAVALRTVFSLSLVIAVFDAGHRMGLAPLGGLYLFTFLFALVIVLIFGVSIPGAWAKYAGESYLAATLPFLWVILRLFYPLVWIFRLLDGVVRRLAGVPLLDSTAVAERLEQTLLDAVSEGEALGAVDEQEKQMIESVMDLRDTEVAEIMTPRTEIIAIAKQASLDEIKQLIADAGHSRIPIYEENIDGIVGIVYAKDLLHLDPVAPFESTQRMRQALFVPESKNLRDLLHEFQSRKVHMAIVLDEYGGTAGLVTIEDILEELVGEIDDEYDPIVPEPLVRIDDDTVDLDARMHVDAVNDELHINLPDEEDYDTIGGFVFTRLGRIPKVGEACEYENVRITVIDAEPRRINRVRLQVNRNGDKPASANTTS